MTAPVRPGTFFAVDVPRPFDAMGNRIAGFTASPSGSIVALRVIENGRPPLSVVVNWQAMLRER
jgi:hypothetical protein